MITILGKQITYNKTECTVIGYIEWEKKIRYVWIEYHGEVILVKAKGTNIR